MAHPENTCRKCHHKWTPRGRSKSTRCPACGSKEVEDINPLFPAIVVLALIGWYIQHAGNSTESPTSSESSGSPSAIAKTDSQAAAPKTPNIKSDDATKSSPTQSKSAASAGVATAPQKASDGKGVVKRSDPARRPVPAQPTMQQMIDSLIVSATTDIAESRLTNPEGNNALEKVRRVLQMDSSNVEASKLLVEISDRYTARFNELMDAGSVEEATVNLRQAEAVTRETAAVMHAHDRLATFYLHSGGGPALQGN